MMAQPCMPLVLGAGLDPRNVAKAIAFCKANNNEHHIPLLMAAGSGRIAYTCLSDRLARPNMHALNKARRPAMIVVGDDEGATTGPMGWAASAQVMSWARGCLVHASGGTQISYMVAVNMAEDLGRLLLVETSSDAAEAWVSALHDASVPTILLLPTGDGVHPVDVEQDEAPSGSRA